MRTTRNTPKRVTRTAKTPAHPQPRQGQSDQKPHVFRKKPISRRQLMKTTVDKPEGQKNQKQDNNQSRKMHRKPQRLKTRKNSSVTTARIPKQEKESREYIQLENQEVGNRENVVIEETIVNQEKKDVTAQDIPVEMIGHDEDHYLCPLCLDYLVKSVSTVCGHSFCEICLNEYLLFFEECSQCLKKIKNTRLSYNIVLDTLVDSFVRQVQTRPENQHYKARVQKWKDWQNRRKARDLQVGMRVDVRDPNFVWCSATIYRTVCRQENRIKYVHVRFEGKDKTHNQEICELSHRIAAFGFYTNRRDIPRYQVTKSGMMRIHDSMVMGEEGKEVKVQMELADE